MFKDNLRKQYLAIIAILFSSLIFGFSAQARTESPQIESFEIVPTNPKSYEPVILRFAKGFGHYLFRGVQMQANRITVNVETRIIPAAGYFPPIPPIRIDLGRLPPGNYEVEVIRDKSISMGVKSFAVGSVSLNNYLPLDAFSDLWWNPAEPGWGMNVTVKNGVLFAAWFAYDSAGRAAWLTIQDAKWNDAWLEDEQLRCYQGQVLRTSGPSLGGILGLNSKVHYDPAGSAKLCFSDDNQSVQFTYTVDSVSNQKTLYRQPF